MNDDVLNIRMIQHYMYCPRRYALMEVNQDWQENAHVIHAELIHERVHDGTHHFSDSKKVVRSSVAVYQDDPEYNLYGITDCVEFCKDPAGVPIHGLQGTFRVQIVEYKPRAPKEESYHETDAIQVFAQKLCADSIWHCRSEAYLYYQDIRKRVKLPFDTEYEAYDTKLRTYLSAMREIRKHHRIPARRKGQKCSGCSLADICFAKERSGSIKEQILLMKEEMP